MWLAFIAVLVTIVTGQGSEHRRRRLHAEMFADLHGDESPSPTARTVIAGRCQTDDDDEHLPEMEPAAEPASASIANTTTMPNSTQLSIPQPEVGFDYGICVGCVVAIVLAQAPTHTPTGCWNIPPLQQSVLRVCATRASNEATASRMYEDVAEQLQQVGVPPELAMALVDGLKRWLADVTPSEAA